MWTPMRLGYSDFFMSGIRAITKRPTCLRPHVDSGASADGVPDFTASSARAPRNDSGSSKAAEPGYLDEVPSPIDRLARSPVSSPLKGDSKRRRWSMKPQVGQTTDFAPLTKHAVARDPLASHESLFTADPFSSEKSQSFYADLPTSLPQRCTTTAPRRASERRSFLSLTGSSSDGPPPHTLSFPRSPSRSSSTSSMHTDDGRASREARFHGRAIRQSLRTTRSKPQRRFSMPPVRTTAVESLVPKRRKWRGSTGPLGIVANSEWV
ncbi:hypothetical protein HDZ31DRAFT_46336 [Schizophyllum fasciatum]